MATFKCFNVKSGVPAASTLGQQKNVPHKKPTDARSIFLEQHKGEIAKLMRSKSQYGRVLFNKSRAKVNQSDLTDAQSRIAAMKAEKNLLRAKLWVANSTTYRKQNEQFMATIQCQIKCQEELANLINKLKSSIANTQHEIDRVTVEILKVSRQIVPECRHQDYVTETRKKFSILQDRYEHGVRMECSLSATNAKLRDELVNLLTDRQSFNAEYAKMIQQLTSDKKYLVELIEYALHTFERCIALYEKIDAQIKRDQKESDNFKQEIFEFRSRIQAMEEKKFVEKKQKPVPLQDLPAKEINRREKLRERYKRRITVYREVLDRLLDFTNCVRIEDVIQKFKLQEEVYYSFFTYSNETGYHMTLMNNMINCLFTEINNLKISNRNTLGEQLATIGKLQNTLRQKRQQNDDLLAKSEKADDHIEDLFTEIGTLCELTECDASLLWQKLGDNTQINLHNLATNTKMLQERILDIIACVYCVERPFNTTVKEIEHACEYPTRLSDIVLTQQCPECAQGEDLNMEEDESATLLPKEEVHKKLMEKLTQPEMQYYLHPLEECRLPRSRQLAQQQK